MAAISREVDRLNGVTGEYLRFARLPKPSLDRQDLNELLGGLLDFLAPELVAARVEVRRELDGAFPSSATARTRGRSRYSSVTPAGGSPQVT